MTGVASLALARRALRNALRRPQFLAPLVIFPTFFLAVNVGGLSRTTNLPGFPQVRGFLDFQLAGAITQSLLLGGVSAGIAVALEIELGFFDRLVASPIPRVSIVFGRLGAAAMIGAGQAVYFLALGLIFGAEIRSGLPGIVVILIISMLTATGFAAAGVTLGLWARNASTVQGVFPLAFVILFVSSAFFPRLLLEEPARGVARYNPLSYIAEGLRHPIIDGFTWSPVRDGLLAAGAVTALFTLTAVAALRGRLRNA